jgi:hypothetical protein
MCATIFVSCFRDLAQAHSFFKTLWFQETSHEAWTYSVRIIEVFRRNCAAESDLSRVMVHTSLFLLFRELCHDAWAKLRLSPMFGCICPNNHMKRRCDRIFSMVNHNPCVGKCPLTSVFLAGHMNQFLLPPVISRQSGITQPRHTLIKFFYLFFIYDSFFISNQNHSDSIS